jgi:outer membrane protein assembly factor BamB
MKFNRVVFVFLLAALTLLLGACSQQPSLLNFPGLTAARDAVYLSEGLHVYAIRAADGAEVRRFPAEPDGNVNFYAPVALLGESQLVVPNSSPSEHSLFSYAPASGEKNWTFTESKGTWIAGTLATEDGFYAPAGDGILYAFNAEGVLRWKQELSKNSLWAAPVTDGKLIFQMTLDQTLFALEPASGSIAWQKDFGQLTFSAPTVAADGRLYVSTLSGTLYALRAENGQEIWNQPLKGNLWGAAVERNGVAYVGTFNGKQGASYALDAASGAILWTQQESGAIFASPLALDDQVIYVMETGLVQSRKLDGSPNWQAELKGKLYATPLNAGDIIIVAPTQGENLLVAFSLQGAQKWAFKPAN